MTQQDFQLSIYDIMPAARINRFQRGDLVSGFLKSGNLNESSILTGIVEKVGRTYLYLDTGVIYRKTAYRGRAQQLVLI